MKTDEIDNTSPESLSLFKSLLFIILGLTLLIFGGRIVVKSAVDLALALNVSEKIIGLTIVALGTSLPELVTSITAIVKKKSDIAIGNIIGSNIFNILFVLGASALARPMEYSQTFNKDVYFLIFGTILLLLAIFTGKKGKLDRWQAVLFILIYLGYVIYYIVV
jgi:cation:H+ antiporter